MAYIQAGVSSPRGPRGNLSPEIQALLDAAEMRGGSLAEVAGELSHPERSIMATASNALRNTFGATMKVLNTPLNIVAGVLSNDYTVGEAMKENLSVSDVLLGSPTDRELGAPTRSLDYIGRFAIDVLTDPTTYVTFGAGRAALFGTSQLSKVELGLKTATKLGVEEKTLKMLNKEGDTLFKKMSRYFENPESVDLDDIQRSIADELNLERKELLKKTWLENKEDDIVGEMLAQGKIVDNDEVYKRLQKLSDETPLEQIEKEMVDGALNADFAKRSISRMMEYNPDLANTILDKGGIKMFNKTILSGQRLRDIGRAIPGMNVLDKVTLPIRQQLNKAGNLIGRAFNTNMTKAGAAQESFVNLANKFNNLYKAEEAKVMQSTANLIDNLNITNEEVDFLTAAIEARRRPSDPVLAALYDVKMGLKPDMNIISEDQLMVAGFSMNSFSADARIKRRAGIPITEQKNFVRHFRKEKVITNKYNSKKTFGVQEQKASSSRAFVSDEGEEVVGWTDLEITPEGTVATVRGVADEAGKSPILLKVKQVNKKEVKERIAKDIEDKLASGYTKIEGLQKEINEIMGDIQKTFDKKVLRQFATYLAKADNIDPTTKRFLLSKLSKQTQKINIDEMVETRLATSYKDGVKIKKSLDKLSEEDLNKLLADISTRSQVDPTKVKEFNKLLKQAIKDKKIAKKSAATKAQNAVPKEPKYSIKEFEDEIMGQKKAFNDAQDKLVDSSLDAQKIGEVIGILKKDFQSGLASTRKLDMIIKRRQAIQDILETAQIDRLAGVQKYQDIDKIVEGKFIDELTGKEYEMARATIPEIRELGVEMETNLLAIVTRNSMEARRQAISSDFTREVAKNFGQLASEAPEGWRPISFSEFNLETSRVNFDDIVKGENGEQLVFHPANAEYFERMFKAVMSDDTDEMMRMYDKIQNFTKASLTSIWPMFHGRNAISNVFLNFMNLGMHTLKPAYHIASVNMMNKNRMYNKLSKTYETFINAAPGSANFQKALQAKEEMANMFNQKMFTDKNGYAWTFGELHKIIKNDIVAFNPSIVGQLDVDKTFTENLATTLEAGFNKGVKGGLENTVRGLMTLDADKIAPVKFGKDVGSLFEDQARLVSFFGNLNETGDVIQASNRTKEFLFDYANITNFERKWMKRALPFYTFFRKNVELQVKTLLREPGKIAAEMRFVSNLGDALTDQELTEEEKALLPDWAKQSAIILKNRKGNDIEVMTGIETPTEAFFKQTTGQGLISMISPLVKYPVEAITGYSFFRQKPISEITKADAFINMPDAVKDFIGFTEVPLKDSKGNALKGADGKPLVKYVSLRPERMYNIMNIPITSRAMSFLGKLNDSDATKDDQFIYSVTGIDSRNFNLENEAKVREKELQEQLEKILQDAGLGYSFNRFVLKK